MTKKSGISDPHVAFSENLALSVQFWPRIAVLEISLRNKLIQELETRIDPDFLAGNHPALEERLRLRLQKLNADPTKGSSGTLSSLSLGFWGMLLNKRHEGTLWVPALRHAFLGLGNASRSEVHDRLSKIVLFRNRIAHHENILGVAADDVSETIDWLMELLEPGSSRFNFDGMTFPLHPVE